MSGISKKQDGFGAIEIILSLIIVILIGVVGWLVYKDHHKTAPIAQSSSSTNSSGSSPDNVPLAAVTELVTTFYSKYTACKGDGNCGEDIVKQYGTANLFSYFKPSQGIYTEDPITCSTAFPNSIGGVSGVVPTPTTASGTITENFVTPAQVKFTVVKQSGNLKIDTVTCSPPAKASTGA